MTIRIAFRADASLQMGSGHVMRCLTLANELREKGAEIIFVCREHPGHLFDLIESSKHRVLRLPFAVASATGKLAHAQWLGATQEEDARQSIEVLKSIGHVDWLIVDHYALDVEWEAAMSALTEHIMVIDDLADRVHDCDVLLDQNLHRAGMENRYEKLTPPNCKKLLGPKYALLRPEFKEIRSNLKVRDGSVKRIFVFFGGSDPTNETMKALIAIQQLDRADIAIDVVVGSTNPHREDIAGLCAAQPGAKLHRQINNIAELMASADMAIGAGGGAMWERCCLGLPSIVMSAAKNQDPGCEATAGIGAILYLGKAESVGEELIEGTLRVALSAPDLLMSMSEKSIALVDGQGGMRVVRKLVAPVIALRRAELDDCESIFDWRNDKETRRYSSENRPIPLNEHVTWFKSALENQNRAILIGEINSSAVGVLRFDRKERSAVISVFLVPGNHGKGIGGKMIEQGTLWLESNWPEVTSIEAVIMDGNSASISAFSEAGFKKKAYTYVKQIRK